MAFFEQLGKKITDASQGVAQSGKNVMDVARLNNLISDKKKQIAANYSALGEAYYAAHKDDANPEQSRFVFAIKALFDDIERAENEIKQIKGVVKCPTCGADIPLGAAFCSVCGTVTPEQTKAAAPAGIRTCPQCGKPAAEGNKFCTGCGYNFE